MNYLLLFVLVMKISQINSDLSTKLVGNENLSILGRWLHQPEGTPPPKRRDTNSSTKALIVIWKYGPFLERRHINRFQKHRFSPWEGCSLDDCELSYKMKDLSRADAVVVPLHRMTNKDAKKAALFRNQLARPDQIWIFLTDESPLNTAIYPEYAGIFNWSMSYKAKSDVPVPYGRAVPRRIFQNDTNFDLHLRNKTKLIAVLGSNCSGGNHRWDYIKKLKDLLPNLDIFGHCLNGNATACPGHFGVDCPVLNDYKFYLAFENSNCREYLTEKIFWNSYSKFAIPIIMGPPKKDCFKLLPPLSFLHVDDFLSPKQLADYIVYLDKHYEVYRDYHFWRQKNVVLNEHGYFGSASRHYCRICEALRYNSIDSPKVYSNLEDFWSIGNDCSLPSFQLNSL